MIPITEMTLDAYIELRHSQYIQNMQLALTTVQKELANCRPRATKRKEQLSLNLRLYQGVLDDLAHALKTRQGQYEREYRGRVLQAIKKGKPIADVVLNGDIELRKAKDDYERYLKARETSFGNLKNAITVDSKYGYKVKVQNGQPPTQTHLEYIARGMGEVEQALTALGLNGDLSDIFTKLSLTFSHTNGKHPFLKAKAAGCYTIHQRTLSVGMVIGGRHVPALAHELAHMLDYEAGYAIHDKECSWVAESRWRDSERMAWLTNAAYVVNEFLVVRETFRVSKASKSEAQKAEVSRVRAQLGSYWFRPHEVWARLVEQRLSQVIACSQISVETDYTVLPGYWSSQRFEKLAPCIDPILAEQLALIRDAILVRSTQQTS